MTLYDRILGNPWVYDKVRPFVVGGFSAYQQAFNWLELQEQDVLLDIGCGTGAAFNFLQHAGPYHGFDLDTRALERFRTVHTGTNVHLHSHYITEKDIEAIRPSKVLMIGLIHHLDDRDASALLALLRRGGQVQKVITLDTVYIRGKWINNVLAALDRGRYVRTEEEYRRFFSAASWSPSQSAILRSGNGAACYFASCLEPPGAANRLAA
jgi:SAM-dependent methyltransferase